MLSKAVRGEIAQYKLPDDMIARFEDDRKEKRFDEPDTENLIAALSEIEQKVNDKLTTVYSIPYQLNMMLEKEREQYRKDNKIDDSYGGGGHKKYYGSSGHHKRKFFGKRRY